MIKLKTALSKVSAPDGKKSATREQLREQVGAASDPQAQYFHLLPLVAHRVDAQQQPVSSRYRSARALRSHKLALFQMTVFFAPSYMFTG